MKKMILVSTLLCAALSTYASEDPSQKNSLKESRIANLKKNVAYYKKEMYIEAAGVGASLGLLGMNLWVDCVKKPLPFYLRPFNRKGVPTLAFAGIYLFIQCFAVSLECHGSSSLNLLQIEDPEKYERTPKFFTDAPLYDGGRRIDENGRYKDRDPEAFHPWYDNNRD